MRAAQVHVPTTMGDTSAICVPWMRKKSMGVTNRQDTHAHHKQEKIHLPKRGGHCKQK